MARRSTVCASAQCTQLRVYATALCWAFVYVLSLERSADGDDWPAVTVIRMFNVLGGLMKLAH